MGLSPNLSNKRRKRLLRRTSPKSALLPSSSYHSDIIFVTQRLFREKEIESVFGVKVDSVRTLIRSNKKYAYIKLNKKDLAIDVATKWGII